jgi:hypothetical protein
VDVSGDFDRFNRDTNSLDLSTGEADAGAGHLFDLTGNFLLSLSTAVAPDQPILFQLTNTMTLNDDGTGALTVSLQPLSAMNEKPVGMAFGNSAQVAADGTFVIDLSMKDIPADANPITGTDLVVSVMMEGMTRSADQFCGDLTGMVNMPVPLDLTGSKWAAIRIPDGGALPKPVTSCAGFMGSADGGM